MLKPVEDKIIVKVIKEEVVSTSGFFVGESNEKPSNAVVVAVGPGIMLNDGDFVVPEVEVGDTVAFSKYQGTEVEHEGENYLILAYRDILAIWQ